MSSLEYLPVTIAALMNNTFPLFVIVVAYMLLREALSARQIMVIVTALGGVMAMSINSIYRDAPLSVNGKAYFIGIMLIVSSEVFGSVSYVSVKRITSLNLVQLCSLKMMVIYAVAVFYMVVKAFDDF